MIRPTSITQDLAAIRDAVAPFGDLVHKIGQVMITSRPGRRNPLSDDLGWLSDGAKESDFSVLNAEFRGTAVEELLAKLPFLYGRARIMLMRPKSCLSIHVDRGLRYHYAIDTSPDCFLVEVEGSTTRLHHVPADGVLYEMDAFRTHSAMNTGKCMRIHIVINAADGRRPDDAPPVGRVRSLAAGD